MRRGWKIAIGVVGALVVLLVVNTVIVDHETEAAGATEAGGRILDLQGGRLEVVEKGPRDGSPIVLIHCFTCAINYWNGMIPRLSRTHRVVAIDLLGHGGSEKPSSGYTVPNQADLVAQALAKLRVADAEVVGHSLGGAVAVALAQRSPRLVSRVVIIDTPPTHEEGDLGLVAKLGFAPVIGEFFWRVKPDFAVRKGLEVAFAPGFDVPDEFVEDVKRMNFSAYDESPTGFDDYTKEEPLDQRMRETGKPLLVIMGAKEQIIDEPAERLAEYRQAVPGSRTKLIAGAGHSPNVEKPAETATLVLGFDAPRPAENASARRENARPLAETASRPRAVLDYEPMFDSKQTLTHRLADTADLVIDFATLGEYGLEPLEQSTARPCEARARHGSQRSTGSWRAAIDHFATHA